jgi:hypothetical protein
MPYKRYFLIVLMYIFHSEFISPLHLFLTIVLLILALTVFLKYVIAKDGIAVFLRNYILVITGSALGQVAVYFG